MKFVGGDRYRRKEDPRLLRGQGKYVGDIALPGMLHAVLVRSPHAHARVLRLDATRAREHPGVVDIVAFGDLGAAGAPLPIVPPHAALRGHNFSALAGERVRFVGEAVAAIVAESRYVGEDARDLVDVEYEPLPRLVHRAWTRVGPPSTTTCRTTSPARSPSRAATSTGRCARRPTCASCGCGWGGAAASPWRRAAWWPTGTRRSTSSPVLGLVPGPHQIRQFLGDLPRPGPAPASAWSRPTWAAAFGAKLIVYPEDVLIPLLAHRFGRPVGGSRIDRAPAGRHPGAGQITR